MDMQNIENQFTEFKSQLAALDKKTAEDKLSMVVFSGDLDKIIAAFVIATGAVAMGMDAVISSYTLPSDRPWLSAMVRVRLRTRSVRV